VGRLRDWLDDRTGYRRVIDVALTEPVPGGASFAYVFGSVLTFVLVLQLVTGVFLAMYYSPSASDAWASVAYLQDQVTLGWFVRGLHHYGASAMVIIAGLHMLQTAVWGAYKKPREVNWIIGCLMMALVLAFALTGYLLPWDQTGYWATKVATGIAGSTPLIGEPLQQAIQGGNEYGNLTLTRFYSIHVFILPGTLIALVLGHIYLFRRHGVTPRWGKSEDELERTKGWFWPDQLFRDMVAIALAFAALCFATWRTHGAGLDGPADPASNFDARPEWYFRSLFQALKYFSGTMERLVALGLPVVIGGFLVGLPFLDRKPERDPGKRLVWLGLLGLLFAGAGALTWVSFAEDAADPAYQDAVAEAEAEADQARELARDFGVPAAGGTAVYGLAPDDSPPARYARLGPIEAAAADLWKEHCARCHQGAKREAPEIGYGFASRAWIRDFLRDPDGDRFYGRTELVSKNKKGRMKAVKLQGGDLDAVVEMVYAQSGAADADPTRAAAALAARTGGDGEAVDPLFEPCSNCHPAEEQDGGGYQLVAGADPDPAPNLAGHGSAAHLVDFLADPDKMFGEFNHMPGFGDKLTTAQRWALAEYLVWLRGQQ